MRAELDSDPLKVDLYIVDSTLGTHAKSLHQIDKQSLVANNCIEQNCCSQILRE